MTCVCVMELFSTVEGCANWLLEVVPSFHFICGGSTSHPHESHAHQCYWPGNKSSDTVAQGRYTSYLGSSSVMDAGLETIGARCHFCQRQDFLPFTCPHCTHPFCLAHSSQTNHTCPSTAPTSVNPPAEHGKLQSLKELQTQHLIARHRQQQQEQAVTQAKSAATAGKTRIIPASTQAALNALRSMTPKSIYARAPPKNPIGLTMVQLGKLKNSATGDSTVPVPKRLYVEIQYADVPANGTSTPKKVPYYVDKTWSCGRCLDIIAKKLNVQNENNKTLDERRKLHLWSAGGNLVLAPTQVIGAVVKDGELLIIYRGVERPI